ncbi:bifunctional folylpolyglutamate synthase/dihydrofolate synthase [Candidatus Omnitrophota bacterium]
MDYSSTLKYIDSFINFEKIPRYTYASSFNLERMRTFLKELGDPHYTLSVIHIAGSKGKGSTCSMIASILKEAGYSVGLYTSPHLLDVRERLRVLSRASRGFGDAVTKKEFIDLFERIKPVAEEFKDHKELGRLSFFEILTAAAFLYFREKKVDFAVIETGLGGRLDATNTAKPFVSGITNISMEHADKLGDSLESIAREKAGIIKNNTKVISASQDKEVRDVIKEICSKKRADLYEVGRDVKYSILSSNEFGQVFNVKGRDYSYKDLRLNLLGSHQVENATLAISITRSLDLRVTEENIRDGLKNVSWPGRLQIIRKEPYVILDGAQNVASIKAALKSIKEIFRYKRLISVFGISSDKDIEGVSRELDSASDIVILTRSENLRAKEPVKLKKNFSKADIEVKDNLGLALDRALALTDREDLILITGSLYLVAEAIQKSRSVASAFSL